MKYQRKWLAALAMVLSMCLPLLPTNAWATEVSGGGYIEDSSEAESETADDSSAPETEETGEAAPAEDEAAEEAESADTADDSSAPETEETGEAAPAEDEAAEEAESTDTADTPEAEELIEEEDLTSAEETTEDGEPDAEEEIALTAGESDESDESDDLVSATADGEDDSVLDSGICGDNLTWTLSSDYVLTISGTGDMTNWSSSDMAPWDSYNSSITGAVIEDGVTSIGDHAFDYCRNLTSVTIPDSVTSIGDHAFSSCSSLTNVVIPDSVTSIEGGAFSSCSSLTNVVIPDSVTSIGDSAFSSCSSLTSVVIPDGVTSIGVIAFSSCSSLTSVTIGSGVTSISSHAFSSCSSLTNVVIPDSVTSIGDGAFSSCSSLTSVVIPDGVTSIGVLAFSSCSSLTNVVIPDSVTSIGHYAFQLCKSLTDVCYGGSEDDWKDIDIGELGNSDLTNATIHYNGHSWDEGEVTTDPTCTEEGVMTYTCTVCGETKTEAIPTTEHSWDEGEVTTDSTCIKEGVMTYTCTVCGETKTEAIPTTEHTAGEAVIENEAAATCTEDGAYDSVVYCTVCGEEISRETITVPATGHSWDEGEVTTDPTCIKEGVMTYTCTVCGETKTEAIPATEHTAGEAVIENEAAATCTEDGAYDSVVYCTVCGEEISRETITVPATGHSWDEGEVTTDPTCIKEGVMTYTCTVCGETKTEAIPATEHTAGEAVIENEAAATCTEDGAYDSVVYCTVCGEEISRETITVPATGHSWDEGEVTTDPTCIKEGVMTYTCTVCGDTYTEAVPATGTSDSDTTDDSTSSSTSDSSSSSSSSSSVSDAETSGVKTGDSTSLTLWAALVGISLLAMATILVTRRRFSHKK